MNHFGFLLINFSITSLNSLNTLVEKYINGNNTNKDKQSQSNYSDNLRHDKKYKLKEHSTKSNPISKKESIKSNPISKKESIKSNPISKKESIKSNSISKKESIKNNSIKSSNNKNNNEKTYLPVLVNSAIKKILVINTNKLFLIKLSGLLILYISSIAV